MTTTKTVLSVIEDAMDLGGYDGLVSVNADCSCLKSELAPCGYPQMDCSLGYRVPCSCGEGCDFHITPTKPEGR